MLGDKLAFLAALALLTTRYEMPADEVRTSRRDELLAVVGEIVAVAQAARAKVDGDAVLGLFDRVPAA
jgi:2-dehydropantoate 2-reductase